MSITDLLNQINEQITTATEPGSITPGILGDLLSQLVFQSNYFETNPDEQSFIKNKPQIFAAQIYNGYSDPTIINMSVICNNLGANIAISRSAAGDFLLTADNPVFNGSTSSFNGIIPPTDTLIGGRIVPSLTNGGTMNYIIGYVDDFDTGLTYRIQTGNLIDGLLDDLLKPNCYIIIMNFPAPL